MENINIRRISLSDVAQLQKLSTQTFLETFSAENTTENMNKYLGENFTVDKLSKEVSNPESAFYFVELDEQVIGYLKVNTGESQTEMIGDKSLEIERIYVLKEFHGTKVGQALYEKAIQIAKERGVDYVWLGVWEANKRAISFYKKNGFVEFSTHTFQLGDDEQTDIMMRLQL